MREMGGNGKGYGINGFSFYDATKPIFIEIAMADKYVISYLNFPNKGFSAEHEALAYIQKEQEAWADALARIESHLVMKGEVRTAKFLFDLRMKDPFDHLKNYIKIPNEFNALTARTSCEVILPPPSDTDEGRLMLLLNENESSSDLLDLFLYYGAADLPNQSEEITKRIEHGGALADAARIARLSLKGVSSKLTPDMENVVRTQVSKTLSAREDGLARFDGAFKQTYSNALKLREQHKQNREEISANQQELKTLRKGWDAEIEALRQQVTAFIETEEAGKMWKERARVHGLKGIWALVLFLLSAAAILIAAIAIPIRFETEITALLSKDTPTLLGIVRIGGFLLATSTALWATRLCYKVYLSERHLKLDAEEKLAFHSTWIAMLGRKELDKDSEAVVLAALFRPTQDGIIKDDEASMDLSAAAILSRHLSKPG